MCNPAAAGIGLTVGGGLLNGYTNWANQQALIAAEKKAYARSKKARVEELARQQGFEGEASAGVNNLIGSMSKGNYDASRETSIQSFMDTLASRPSEIPTSFTLGGQKNATEAVTSEIARRVSTAAAEARSRVEALAKLTSYDAAAIDRGLALGENADDLSTINGLRRGSLGVSQSEQTIPAATIMPGGTLLADILSGSGGALTGASWSQGLNPNALST